MEIFLTRAAAVLPDPGTAVHLPWRYSHLLCTGGEPSLLPDQLAQPLRGVG